VHACFHWLILPCFLLGVAAAAPPVDYERDIKPLLRERCVSCHGQLKQKGGLRLDAGSLIAKGGDSGPAHSLILERILSTDEEERMPPEGKPLTPDKVALLRAWIDQGAPSPPNEPVPGSPRDHWAFQPVTRLAIPAVNNRSWPRNPIDNFILARLEARGWQPSPPASEAALLRRLHLDLTGLPPSLDEQWRPTTIEQLLARPAYGERWARHWLDVVRYADSNGYERDAEKPFVWRYRDYVIQALNNDKPFNRFILEQIAGDRLPDATAETTIATGFLRLGHWDDEPADPAADRYDQLDDIVSTTGQAFLGLTIGCARCHDHKFEPLSTRDYYSMVAVFNSLERPQKGRTELTVGEAYIWQESPSPPKTHILVRGSPANLGPEVTPAVPVILAPQQPAFPSPRLGLAHWIASDDNPVTARVIVNRVWQQHFGQGLVRTANDFGLMGEQPTHPELLDWLAHWFIHDAQWSLKRLHHLILSSQTWRMSKSVRAEYAAVDPDNLLLWRTPYRRLEVEAIRDATLFVSGRFNAKAFGPAMRPPIPAAALEANTDKDKIWKVSDEAETSRRTIYAFVKRGLVVPMLEVLDFADTVSSCPQRQITTVAPQALSLFNGGFVNEQAAHFALRLQREAGSHPHAQISLAWRLALGREPTAAEAEAARAFLGRESLKELCRVILNLNEFLYPE
jgi:mono/diheme cytochrome c family protein